ncbi:MAG: hypothetical protein M3Q85_06650 [Acidobacteriota bacterium]|nr:hypothetical protein [Acidobacteriota bacterium]
MAARRIDADIDRLYQLAPEAFTPARNALAKTAGADAPAVKGLAKPPMPAWAVNQVYWQQREVYDALISAAKALRQTHKTILSGKTGDLRGAGKAHEAAVDAALKAALSLLAAHGHPATDTTRQAIATTLRALPADEPPGRLSRTLQPGGFEMLAGLSIAAGARLPAAGGSASKPVAGAVARSGKAGKAGPQQAAKPRREAPGQPAPRVDPRAVARAREAAARAARELREAEHTARREEFEAARAARDADKAARQLEAAQKTLAAAQEEFHEAEAAATEATRIKDAADARAAAADQALEAARRKVE